MSTFLLRVDACYIFLSFSLVVDDKCWRAYLSHLN